MAAGDFNDGAPTVAEGGLALDSLPARDLWVGELDLDEGAGSYKLVVDDGFGGRNRSLCVTCGALGGAAGSGAALPLDSRPPHPRSDNHANANLVTPKRAAALLDVALRDPDALLGCAATHDARVVHFGAEFGGRALRRPLSTDGQATCAALGRAQSDRTVGLGIRLEVQLSSPRSLYRTEAGADGGGGTFRLTGPEVGSALSSLLWETTPDEALQAVAEARRLLDDPRARRAMPPLAEQRLGVEEALTLDKRDRVGASDAVLREAMLAEAGATVAHVASDGAGRFHDLLRSGEAVQAPTLSEFYGLGGPGGLADAEDDDRAGVLGPGAVLAATAHADQTSPVPRGLFVRERLLCQSLGTPPANAGGVPDVDPDASTRHRFGQHIDDPACSSCHTDIDPAGFGFERFDPLGRGRATDAGAPVDHSGVVVGPEGVGQTSQDDFGSLHGLGALVAQSEAAPRSSSSSSRQVWRPAVGRDAASGDRVLDRLADDFVAHDHHIRDLLVAVVPSPELVTRQ